jgi:hypothetical protein
MNAAAQQAESEPEFKKFGRDGYKPGMYSLDLSFVAEYPITVNGELSTFGELYAKLKGSQIEQPERFQHYRATTDNGKLDFNCDWTVASILKKLTNHRRNGIDPYGVTWFYFGHDWSRDADESYSFFAVYQGKIVDEDCHFNAEEPLILIKKKDDDPIWHSHPLLDDAWERYWYRKFYTETVIGQLMVMRPDEPILYHFTRPLPQGHDPTRDAAYVTLVKTYHLLWAMIPLLVAIAFPFLRWYMAAVAGLLIIDVLWRAWTTRRYFQ